MTWLEDCWVYVGTELIPQSLQLQEQVSLVSLGRCQKPAECAKWNCAVKSGGGACISLLSRD
jgi:hypothetical protein